MSGEQRTDPYFEAPWWRQENPVGSTLLGALQSVCFSDGNPEKQVSEIATRCIKNAWAKGQLPRREGKRWVVGYRVYKTFFSTYVEPIYCGPAEPGHFRDRYVTCKVQRKP